MARTIPITPAAPDKLVSTALEGDGMGCHAGGESLLAAAQQAGLKTAYIPRPDEHGPGGWMEATGQTRFDLVAPDLMAMANQLGIA